MLKSHDTESDENMDGAKSAECVVGTTLGVGTDKTLLIPMPLSILLLSDSFF